jgi:hypothetical protein
VRKSGAGIGGARAAVALLVLGVLTACESPPAAKSEAATVDPATNAAPWRPLFDGATPSGWRVVSSGAGGPVDVENGRLVLGQGGPLTAIALDPAAAAALPRDDYELELIAARLLGNDFFVGLSFPVPKGELTLILGGWGGALCGLSCLDGYDASGNETKSFHRFEKGRDYRVRVRVASGRVMATVDGELLADVDSNAHRCELRTEVAPCAPLGLATWETTASVAALRWRPLAPPR